MSALFSVPIVLLLVRAQKRHEKIIKAVREYLRDNFPYLQINFAAPGTILQPLEIRALSRDASSPLQALEIREQRRVSTDRPAYTVVTATINVKDFDPSTDFTATIVPQKLVNRMFSSENIVLGIDAIDKKLMLHGNPKGSAEKFFHQHLNFLNLIVNTKGFMNCKIEKKGSKMEIHQAHNIFKLKRVIQALEVLKSLILVS